MSDSNITKRALAVSLKELMQQMPFNKIQVSQICERCGMNRKSFYYHFKDKYDLVNWIFDTDIIPFVKKSSDLDSFEERIEIIREVYRYLYDNRSFYRPALKIEGQNSLSDHFKDFFYSPSQLRLKSLLGDIGEDEFAINFILDAVFTATKRWLLDPNCIPPDEFVSKLVNLIVAFNQVISKEIENKKTAAAKGD